MALIKCPECGKEISSMAIACPNCGYSTQAAKANIRIPVTITRPSAFGFAMKGNVQIDNRLIGEIKSGGTLKTTVELGRHSISTNTHGEPFAGASGLEFEVTERTKEVYVEIAYKASFTSSTGGKLVIKEIKCR